MFLVGSVGWLLVLFVFRWFRLLWVGSVCFLLVPLGRFCLLFVGSVFGQFCLLFVWSVCCLLVLFVFLFDCWGLKLGSVG